MKSNVIAAVAGGLVLGAAVFLPIGANAAHVAEVNSASQAKVVAPAGEVANEQLASDSSNSVEAAGLDPIAAVDPTIATDPVATPDPIAVTPPAFSGGDDDEDSNEDDSHDEGAEHDESDD